MSTIKVTDQMVDLYFNGADTTHLERTIAKGRLQRVLDSLPECHHDERRNLPTPKPKPEEAND